MLDICGLLPCTGTALQSVGAHFVLKPLLHSVQPLAIHFQLLTNIAIFQSLEFAVALLAHYQIGRDTVRVALITFGTRSQLVFDFNKNTTTKDVQHGLWTAPLNGGGTNTDIALRMAQEQMFSSVHGQRYDHIKSHHHPNYQ